MTDPGLSNRLRQRSRRAGLMVGISMALTIAVCIGGFAAIYAGLIPYVSDVVPIAAPAATRAPTRTVAIEQSQAQTQPAANTEPEAEAPPPTAAPPPTPAPDAFQPDYQSSSAQSINFRSSPGVTADNSNLLYALPPATPLQYLGEDAPTDDPAQDGQRWMRFRNEEGDEGWIREIDAEPYQE